MTVNLTDALMEAAELLVEADRLYRGAEKHLRACDMHMINMRELVEQERLRDRRADIKYVPTPSLGRP